MKLSIVTTLYQSSSYVEEFYIRITKEAKKITDDYEIIFVDDGSPDDSLQKALALHEKDNKIIVIELSRNFGHHKAIMTGLLHTNGEYVFLIDSDLEEEPELLGKLWDELHKEKDLDVVYGVQERRKGRWFEKFTGSLFWKLFNKLAHVEIAENPLTVRLMKKKYVISLLKFKEKELFLAGVFQLVGFKQKPFSINKKIKDSTTYNFLQKMKLLNNAIVSFSSFPLYLSFYLGTTISIFSFLYGLYLIVNRLFYNTVTSGWTSLMVSIWFLSGVLLLTIGILGLYISKIFQEVKNRPIVEKKFYGKNNEQSE
jgi:putative glycosyltransferase